MEYTLSFSEALEVLTNNEGWVQGEMFRDGVVLMFYSCSTVYNHIHVHDFTLDSFNNCKSELQITRRMLSQRFRVVKTQPDALRKI